MASGAWLRFQAAGQLPIAQNPASAYTPLMALAKVQQQLRRVAQLIMDGVDDVVPA